MDHYKKYKTEMPGQIQVPDQITTPGQIQVPDQITTPEQIQTPEQIDTPRLTYEELPIFTLEELAQYNGRQGRPAYVAVNGIVYDVSGHSTWGRGFHYDMVPGTDVTEHYRRCHGHSILERLNIIGRLVK